MDQSDTVIALIYDFDFTLITGNMQEFGLIKDLGYEIEEFWKLSNGYAKREKMDGNLACMGLIKYIMYRDNRRFDREFLKSYGKTLDGHFMPGLDSWFDSINKVGEELGVKIEHYVISSGFREIIEGSSIFHNFKEVFGCEFQYGPDGTAIWPKNVINYSGKTQFISRISKGALDLADSDKVNSLMEGCRRIPYSRMIYFGDGFTDIPCMRIVKQNGGFSIGVYQESDDVAKKLLKDGRVNFIQKADYSYGGDLFNLVSKIIRKMDVDDELDLEHCDQRRIIEE